MEVAEMEVEKIYELIKNRQYVQARNALIEYNEVDIADFFERLENKELIRIFRLLPKELSAEVFSYLPNELRLQMVESFSDREVSDIMNELFLDDTIDFLEEMPANVVRRVLSNANPKMRKLINQFLTYPEDSAGSLMTIEYVALKKDMTASQAMDIIRKTGVDKETINTCYVVSPRRELEGAISIRNLILAEPSQKIDSIMQPHVISVKTQDDQEQIAMLFRKYSLSAMPVVDNENRLVGIITIDDIVEVIEQENTEDMHKMAAIEPSEEEYLKTGSFVLARRRIIWLFVLMVSATFTGNIMRGYENVLAASAILASFIPMLMDTGGNAGSQSATLIIRGIALGQIASRDVFRVLLKELTVGFVAGIVLGAANFIKILLVDNMIFKANIPITLVWVVCLSVSLTVILSKVVGALLPLLANKVRLDPAIMASPIITTIVDAGALIIYFTLAVNFLGLFA
ncbi:MAG: magnesium transporter [Clostridiales bacterium]|jgi:magnesium transporter|nr:magnesium transporter [Clostridiales bacterium]